MAPRKLKDDTDLERGRRLEEERKKIWKSRAKYREETGLSAGTLESCEARGADISASCLEIIAMRGGDIYYILTGKRTAAHAADAGAKNESSGITLTAEQLDAMERFDRIVSAILELRNLAAHDAQYAAEVRDELARLEAQMRETERHSA